VYGQAPETTIAQLSEEGVDLTKVHDDKWNGTKVWSWVREGRHGDQPVLDRAGPPAVREADRGAEESAAASGAGRLARCHVEKYQPLGKGWWRPSA